LDDVEFDLITLFEHFVPVHLNCRVVNECVRPAFKSDESVAFGVAKPLGRASSLGAGERDE
jgi:hypothetical protein